MFLTYIKTPHQTNESWHMYMQKVWYSSSYLNHCFKKINLRQGRCSLRSSYLCGHGHNVLTSMSMDSACASYEFKTIEVLFLLVLCKLRNLVFMTGFSTLIFALLVSHLIQETKTLPQISVLTKNDPENEELGWKIEKGKKIIFIFKEITPNFDIVFNYFHLIINWFELDHGNIVDDTVQHWT